MDNLTYLVGMLERPAIDAVVARVQPSLGEPCNVSAFERAGSNGEEGAIPV